MAAMTCGCVRVSKSLLPRKSIGQSAKRVPRNSASLNRCRWIMVPIAPSRMTTRFFKSASRARARRDCCCAGMLSDLRLFEHPRTQAEGMADRIRQLGAVQRVEVKLIDTVLAKPLHLLDRHMSGDHAAGLGIFI